MTFETFVRANARVSDETVKRYSKWRTRVEGKLSGRRLTQEAVDEIADWLKREYKPNSLQPVISAVNLWLKWKGTDFRIRRPPKSYNPHPQTIADGDYRGRLATITGPMERLAVRLSHDTGWSPNDVVAIERGHVDLGGEIVIVRKVRTKTHVAAEAILEKETADELRTYLGSIAPDASAYVFPGDRRKGRPHRNRTWVNELLKRHGFAFTPRAFRSNLATAWPGDDIKGLMVQGGWSDPKTIFSHYRGNVRERQVSSFESATGRPAKDHDRDSDVPGYG